MRILASFEEKTGMKTNILSLVLLPGLLFALSPLLFFPLFLSGQTAGGKVMGTVRNKDGQALEAATVLLHRQKDSLVVRTAVTNGAGAFEFTGVAVGKYFLSVSSVGYRDARTAMIEVGAEGPVLAPDLVLSPVAEGLKEASVVSQKHFLQWKMDKLVVD